MPNKSHSTTDYFTSEVESFASHYRTKACFRDRLKLFVEAVQGAAPPPANVLDFGCGPGIIAVTLGELGYNVLGLDGAKGMVEAANANARSLQLKNVRFQHIEAAQLQLPAAGFDAVICSSVLEYVEDDLGLIRKLTDALSPGGCLMISVPTTESLGGMLEDFRHSMSKRLLRRERSPQLNYCLRRYRRKDFLAQLETLGLWPFNCTPFEFPLFGPFGTILSRSRFIGIMVLIIAQKPRL